MIQMIVAHDDNRIIGRGLEIPWRIKADMENFKKITSGHPVVMGRKTWESLPPKFRPLPNRTNIVLSKDLNWRAEGALVRSSVVDVVMDHGSDLFVIGGEKVYEAFLSHTKKLYVTRVYGKYEGDIFFPSYDRDFVERSRSELFDENGVKFRFLEFENVEL